MAEFKVGDQVTMWTYNGLKTVEITGYTTGIIPEELLYKVKGAGIVTGQKKHLDE